MVQAAAAPGRMQQQQQHKQQLLDVYCLNHKHSSSNGSSSNICTSNGI